VSLPVIFMRESGERVIVNWDAVTYIAPADEDETKGSIIHFNSAQPGGETQIPVREALEAIERRLQSATRA
jgi:hypothetical protein